MRNQTVLTVCGLHSSLQRPDTFWNCFSDNENFWTQTTVNCWKNLVTIFSVKPRWDPLRAFGFERRRLGGLEVVWRAWWGSWSPSWDRVYLENVWSTGGRWNVYVFYHPWGVWLVQVFWTLNSRCWFFLWYCWSKLITVSYLSSYYATSRDEYKVVFELRLTRFISVDFQFFSRSSPWQWGKPKEGEEDPVVLLW